MTSCERNTRSSRHGRARLRPSRRRTIQRTTRTNYRIKREHPNPLRKRGKYKTRKKQVAREALAARGTGGRGSVRAADEPFNAQQRTNFRSKREHPNPLRKRGKHKAENIPARCVSEGNTKQERNKSRAKHSQLAAREGEAPSEPQLHGAGGRGSVRAGWSTGFSLRPRTKERERHRR